MDSAQAFHQERAFTLALAEKIGTPRALTVSLLLKSEEYGQLLDLTIDPNAYQDTRNFADDYLITKVLSKSPNVPTGINRSAIATASFLESEQSCHDSTTRLLRETAYPSWLGEYIHNVSVIMGPLNQPRLDEIADLCRHGSGATIGVKGQGLVASDKFDAVPTCTEELLPFAPSLMGSMWSEFRPHPRVVPGSKFFTVPKNAKTDRGCCTEPTLNQWLQLGIGTYLRSRLLRFGVDIRDQRINQGLASYARQFDLATLDLSSASDHISVGLACLVLPPRWLHLLSLARSQKCEVEGEIIELEKFCSMGNGYTFALETILFYAALMTATPEPDRWGISAYGDDLICHQRHAPRVVEILEYLGFRINSKKSYLAGNFFESCGTDWFKDQNVRPFYLQWDPDDQVPYTVSIANKLRLYSSRVLNGQGCDSVYRGLWKHLYHQAPVAWRSCKVPAHFGDQGFITSLSEAKPLPASTIVLDGERCHGWEGYRCTRIKVIPTVRDKRTPGVLLAALAGSTSDDNGLLDYALSSMSRHLGFDRVMRLLQRELVYASLNTWDAPETRGREPVRGLYRMSRPDKQAFTSYWPAGLDWI